MNRPVQGSGADVSAGLPRLLDHRLHPDRPAPRHQRASSASLIDEAHARGIKVFFDIITNHTADVIDYEEGAYTYVHEVGRPVRRRRRHRLRRLAVRRPATRSRSSTRRRRSRTRRSSGPPEDETVKVPAWLNDPTLYHNRGNAAFDGPRATCTATSSGSTTCSPSSRRSVDGMIDIYQYWVGFGVDGFRIDTVKHVNMEFWQKFAPEMLDAAHESGADDFFMFGEVYDANPAAMSRYTTEGGLQATIDFGFQARAQGFATGRPTTELRDLFAGDDYYTDADSNAYSLPTFLGNHDMGRIGTSSRTPAVAPDEQLSRSLLAHALMYLTRGQPVVYYGDEQGFTGDGGDKDARQDMFAQPGGQLQRRRPHRHRRHDGGGQLRPGAPDLPAPRRAVRACATSTRRWPTAPRSTGTPATTRACTRSAASTPTSRSSTSSPRTTRPARRRSASRRSTRGRRSSRSGRRGRRRCGPTRRAGSRSPCRRCPPSSGGRRSR